jgi:hypothetical protein
MVVIQIKVQKGYTFLKLTDTVQRSTPFQEFLGDSKHPLAFSVNPFDVVLIPVKGL